MDYQFLFFYLTIVQATDTVCSEIKTPGKYTYSPLGHVYKYIYSCMVSIATVL